MWLVLDIPSGRPGSRRSSKGFVAPMSLTR
jgi:hypothetical protein